MRDRVNWDVLWMTVAFAFSQRSIDEDTAHGCVVIDKDNKFLSMGYNSFPRDCLDDQLPLTRPDKYDAILHSEINAVINSNKDLKGATAYITGYPCSVCFGQMLNAGIKKIIYGPVQSHMLSEERIKLISLMNVSQKTGKHKIEIIKFEDMKKVDELYEFLDMIKEYIKEKT